MSPGTQRLSDAVMLLALTVCSIPEQANRNLMKQTCPSKNGDFSLKLSKAMDWGIFL
jgi:hypothetical protein